MRAALNAVLILALVAGALVGTAGLSSMRENDHCQRVWTPREGGPQSRTIISAWPPGRRCELLARDGSVIDRESTSATGFLVLLVLEVGLLALVLRAWRRLPFGLRTAAVAAVGLLAWGVASLWYDPMAALFGGAFLVGAPVGFAVDRRLRPRDAVPGWRTNGLFGLAVAPCAAFVGLWVWLALAGPLAPAVTVALIAAGAALVDRFAEPPGLTLDDGARRTRQI